MADLEVEIVPAGLRQRDPAGAVADRHGHTPDHLHPHDSDHHHDHEHEHDQQHPHNHAPGAPPHIAVLARPLPDGTVTHSLVFDSVPARRGRTGSHRDGNVRPAVPACPSPRNRAAVGIAVFTAGLFVVRGAH